MGHRIWLVIVFVTSRSFVDEAEIENLIGGDIFSAVAQALLGEVDGAFHPGLISAAIGRKPAQVQFKKRFRQRLVLDVEIIAQNLHRFAAVLSGKVQPAHASFDERKHLRRIGFDFLVSRADAAAWICRHVIAAVSEPGETLALQDQWPRRCEQAGGDTAGPKGQNRFFLGTDHDGGDVFVRCEAVFLQQQLHQQIDRSAA